MYIYIKREREKEGGRERERERDREREIEREREKDLAASAHTLRNLVQEVALAPALRLPDRRCIPSFGTIFTD